MELINEWFPTGKFRKVYTRLRTDSSYEKELLTALPFTGHALHKSEMEYHGKFVHTLKRIKHIALMSIIDLGYANCSLATQTVAPTQSGFQGIKRCVQYLTIHAHKTIFYHSNYYDGSNFIRLIWSGNQVEYHTAKNCLECYQYTDHAIILIRRQSVSGIIHNLLGVAVCWNV